MDPMTMALILAYFVQGAASDLAFHLRGEESPRDQRRAQRQKAAVDWAQHRGRRPPRPTGPVRQALRERWADAGVRATARRRARAAVRNPLQLERIERRERRRADARRERWQRRDARREQRRRDREVAKAAREEAFVNPTPQDEEWTAYRLPADTDLQCGDVVPAEPEWMKEGFVDAARAAGYEGPIDYDKARLLPEHWCHRHFPDGFCGRETGGGLYCDGCNSQLQAEVGAPVELAKPDPPVDHEPPTEQESAPPDHFRDEDGVPVCRYCGDNLDRCPAGGAATSHCASDEAAAEAAAYVATHPAAQCPECGRWVDGERDDDGVAHYSHNCRDTAWREHPPTEWTVPPAPPEDDRPQPVAGDTAPPEQPTAAEPKGTLMAVITPAEGGLESVDVFANTYAQIVNDLWSATETTAANFPPELAPGTNAALNTLLRDLDAMGTAGLEALRAAVAADKAVRDAYAATGNTASNKSVLVS